MNTRHEYQDLFDLYWPIGVAVFVVIAALVVFVAIRFRSTGDEFPEARDESRAEYVYAAALVATAALLLVFTFGTIDDLTSPAAQRARLDVRVTAAKWRWRFEYAASGTTVQGTDTLAPTLVVPANTPVRFVGTSIDVQHAFWVPALRFKRDLFPRRSTSFVLVFDDPGFHRGGGECAEFCGLRHANMEFNVDVVSPDQFRAWLGQRG